MSAKHKLNVACVYACLVVAAVAGTTFNSFGVFVIAAVLLIVGEIFAGSIRLGDYRRHRR